MGRQALNTRLLKQTIIIHEREREALIAILEKNGQVLKGLRREQMG